MTSSASPSSVMQPQPAAADVAAAHFGHLFAFPTDTVFVVHSAGLRCNAADKAAARLAASGWPVKEMIGGTMGRRHEGFDLVSS